MRRHRSELRDIPYVGERTEADLRALGFETVASLKGQDPQELYERECLLRGCKVDRCQLYLYRMIVYYADNETRDPEKLRWWYWKDRDKGEKKR